MLEYDMLYGDMVSFDGVNPYLPTTLEMGVFDIYVTDIVHNEGKLFVYGNRFNEHSKIKLDGKIKDTIYVTQNCIAVECDSLEKFTTLQISQYTYDRIELRTSAEYEINSFISPTE